ncbi:hypothetical protein [Helicobacter sp. 23-1045]
MDKETSASPCFANIEKQSNDKKQNNHRFCVFRARFCILIQIAESKRRRICKFSPPPPKCVRGIKGVG